MTDGADPSRRADTTGGTERFPFGANWRRFLAVIDDRRIEQATQSLRDTLGVTSLEGVTFLDAGSGSGLFSLAARRLGATVRSFDLDADSVACTNELRRRYAPNDAQWIVESGSVLDPDYLGGLGRFDVVYSWGVLHHTGAMWTAIDNVAGLVAPGGQLFIAIYNDQGRTSRRWTTVKRTYNRLPPALRWLVLGPAFLRLWGPTTVRDLRRGTPGRTWRQYADRSGRGMSPWRDVVDWVGGYPFEVAGVDEIVAFLGHRGFRSELVLDVGSGSGCNQFVLRAA